jgi:hypothetical protein
MIKVLHLDARASRPRPAAPGASPALTPEPPDAGPLRSDRRPESPLREGPPGQDPAVPARSPVPLRRKRPAGTQGSGDIDKPSAVTERACSIGDHALSEIDAPGPHLTPACGGRLRRPRTEEWTLPDHHPRSRRQLGALDPRSPITEEGLTTAPLPPPRRPRVTLSLPVDRAAEAKEMRHFCSLAVHLCESERVQKPSLRTGFLCGCSLRPFGTQSNFPRQNRRLAPCVPEQSLQERLDGRDRRSKRWLTVLEPERD